MFTVSRISPSAQIICGRQGEWSTQWLLFILFQSNWPPPSWRLNWRHTAANILNRCYPLSLADHCCQCTSCTVQWDSNQNQEEIDNQAGFNKQLGKREYKTDWCSKKSTCQNQRIKRCVFYHCCFHNSTSLGHYYYRAKYMVAGELQIHLVHSMLWYCLHSALCFWSGLDFSVGMP